MGHRWHIIISVFLLYSTGSFSSSVDTVRGFIGDSALLSCSIPLSELQDRIEEFHVHWRDDEGKHVFDIIGCNNSVEDQAPEYKNRVETFPDEQKKGNFSIKLNGLQKTDEKKYTCTITTITGQYQNETNIKLQVEDGPRGNCGGLHGELTSIVSLLISFSLSFIFQCRVQISSISPCWK